MHHEALLVLSNWIGGARNCSSRRGSGSSWCLGLVVIVLTGCHASAGPVVGYSFGHGMIVGWEAGGGAEARLRANVGQSYRLASANESLEPNQIEPLVTTSVVEADSASEADEEEAEDPEDAEQSEDNQALPGLRIEEVASYVVYEPWFFAGATLGLAVNHRESNVGLVAGGWEGVPVGGWSLDSPEMSDVNGVVSIAIGYRYLAGAHEIYLTPKVGLMEEFKL